MQRRPCARCWEAIEINTTLCLPAKSLLSLKSGSCIASSFCRAFCNTKWSQTAEVNVIKLWNKSQQLILYRSDSDPTKGQFVFLLPVSELLSPSLSSSNAWFFLCLWPYSSQCLRSTLWWGSEGGTEESCSFSYIFDLEYTLHTAWLIDSTFKDFWATTWQPWQVFPCELAFLFSHRTRATWIEKLELIKDFINSQPVLQNKRLND